MVGLVVGVCEGHDERELGEPLGHLRRVPGGNRGIGAVAEPDVRRVGARPVVGRLLLEQPRQVRRSERGRPRRVRYQRHQRLVGVADVRLAHPAFLRSLVELERHQPVGARHHRADARGGGAHQLHRGAERAAGNFQRAHQHREQRARPAAVEAAEAVVHSLAERDCDGTEGQRHAFDLDGLADAGVREVLVGDAADDGRGNVALGGGPLRRVPLHVLEQLVERGLAARGVVKNALAVRAVLHACERVLAIQRRILQRRVVVRPGLAVGCIPDERLAAVRVAQVPAVRADEVRGTGAVFQVGQVAGLAPAPLVQDVVDQAVQERRVGLRLDRHPLGGERTGDRHVRLDLHALRAAHARIRFAPDADHAAGGFDVVAAVDDEVYVRRVGRDDEGAMP